MPLQIGTHVEAEFDRVVDGDTIRVFLPGQTASESLRILALDTEESQAGGTKPVTPWGKAAKLRAEQFFGGASRVAIEFPGVESYEECLDKYRGNFGRLLVYVYRDGVDFQETMIREGYSPYFMKYGNADFSGHHRRYGRAERVAQQAQIGVWDQLTVNGQEMRNYAALGTWWKLRARVIDEYRSIRPHFDNLFNTRLDYRTLFSMAENGDSVTLFTELRWIQRVGGIHGLIDNGSVDRPFGLFIPDIESESGQEIIRFLNNRYISAGEEKPRRSYAYVTGQLQFYRGNPQLIVESTGQVSDDMPSSADSENDSQVALRIASLVPDPEGADAGHESITLRNGGTNEVDLTGWRLRDQSGHELGLTGTIPPGGLLQIQLLPHELPLTNSGDEIYLVDPDGALQDRAAYTAADVKAGQAIEFD